MATDANEIAEAPPDDLVPLAPYVASAGRVAEVRTFDRVPRLVRRAQERDLAAFGELYRTFYPALFRMARLRLGDGADDIVAETFTRAWRALPGYRKTGAPFAAWLYGIARHVVFDEWARQRRVELHAVLPDVEEPWREDERISVADALAQLPDEQRQVIELRYLIGLSNEEVGAALGKSPGAVNTQRWRALQTLRGKLEDDDRNV